MSPTFPAPDPTTQTRVVSAVRKGAFPQVAAMAAGVPAAVFRWWMTRGRRPDAVEPYASFAAEVDAAAAWARVVAEVQVHDEQCLNWLRYGPGRDRAGGPGWAAASKPPPRRRRGQVSLATMEFLGRMLEVITPFPEARMALVEFMRREEEARTNPRRANRRLK